MKEVVKPNVVRLVDHVDDNRFWSPAECLRELADGIEKGTIEADSVLVHVVRRCPEHRDEIVTTSYVAQMTISEQIHLLESVKLGLLMGGGG